MSTQDKKTQSAAFKRRLYVFVLRTIKLIEKLPKNSTTKIIGDQLLRSATSILANYIEAQASSSKKDFTNFFHHSLKSANESKVWLALLRDTDNGDKIEIQWLLSELDAFSGIFASSLLTLKGRK